MSSAASDPKMVRVRTGSRLHFGLLDVAAPFGGIGVMVDEPSTEVAIRFSDKFSCDPDFADRIEPIGRRIADFAGLVTLPSCRVEVNRNAFAHLGLGSGTQMAMAIAEGICQSLDLQVTKQQLVGFAQRGKRSAVGVHGYFAGGLIFESGNDGEPSGNELNTIQSQVVLPAEWCVCVFRPAAESPQVSGDLEQQQFAELSSVDSVTMKRLTDLIRDGILPAAEAGEFRTFATSVQAYNHASGLLFESVQGGPYNGAAVAELVQTLERHGAQGIGQSSWGPGVFTWFESQREAEVFGEQLPQSATLVAITHPRATGRELSG
ncbi:MAG: beta-ribofuranosylaminobenzene 5'-phosphate synthase [Rubripirellula sp.]